MNKAQHYENLVFHNDFSDEEWKKLNDEINEWIDNDATEDEKWQYIYSGAGEMLSTVLDAIEVIERERNVS